MSTNFHDRLIQKYGKQFERYGATPKGSYWASQYRQELRFKIILDEINTVSASMVKNIADIGCGYGALAKYIQSNHIFKNYRYQGYDICSDLIKSCRARLSYKNAQFFVGDYPSIKVSFTVMSGTYNLTATQDLEIWESYLFTCLKRCWDRTSEAMIFNLQIDKKARISENNIYFSEKDNVLHKCISYFGPTRVVLNEGIPNDATFIVIR